MKQRRAPPQPAAPSPLCPNCGRPQATAADMIRLRSRAAGFDDRLVCWDHLGPFHRPEDEIADVETLRATVARLRYAFSNAQCSYVATMRAALRGVGRGPGG